MGLTLVFAPVADMGAVYLACRHRARRRVLPAYAVRLLREPTPKVAMRLFTWSITYVTLLFGAMALDVLLRHGFEGGRLPRWVGQVVSSREVALCRVRGRLLTVDPRFTARTWP